MFDAMQVEWNAPDGFPNLSKFKYVAIDLETRDPNLKSKGSGAVKGDGEIIGVAIAVDESGFKWKGYYPIAHSAGNIDKRIVLDYVKEICGYDNVKIFHNAMYDVSWLRSYGIEIKGKIIDTMVMLSLINENRMWFTLNSATWDYLQKRKDETVLNEVAASQGIDPKSEMYKLPAMYVGQYAEADAALTLELYHALNKEIDKQNLHKVFKLETQLFPCLVDMKFKGVRVDVEKAHILESQLISKEKELLQSVEKETGIYPEIWAARSIAKVFDKLSLTYDRTEKSNAPSFTKTFLQDHENPLVKKIAKAREINKMHTTFIQSILKHVHKGRIHADINPIRSDSGGTVTGRFSYSNPNLQQMPIRNPELGADIRGLFLPEREHLWGSFDYSQQEPRLVVHYAADDENISQQDAVKNIVQQFKNDSVDFHQVVADMAGIERKQAKTINLGLFYGMGKAKLQNELGLEKHEAEALFDQYHENVPFVKALMRQTMNAAEEDGVIQTIGGRHCRFDRWEINEYTPGVMKKLGTKIEIAELFRERIRENYPEFTAENWRHVEKDLTSEHPKKIKRALTYKALNKLIQGSAADMTKQAMLDLYNEGIVPHIQIHDELDISVSDEKQGARVKEIMENVKPGGTTMKVPNKVDAEYGETWGDIKG